MNPGASPGPKFHIKQGIYLKGLNLAYKIWKKLILVIALQY
jgi:hypothetical protein